MRVASIAEAVATLAALEKMLMEDPAGMTGFDYTSSDDFVRSEIA